MLEQQSHQVEVPPIGGCVERRDTEAVVRVDVGSSFQQMGNRGQIPVSRRSDELDVHVRQVRQVRGLKQRVRAEEGSQQCAQTPPGAETVLHDRILRR